MIFNTALHVTALHPTARHSTSRHDIQFPAQHATAPHPTTLHLTTRHSIQFPAQHGTPRHSTAHHITSRHGTTHHDTSPHAMNKTPHPPQDPRYHPRRYPEVSNDTSDMTPPPEPTYKMTEGETEDAEEYRRIRALIAKEPDVFEVLALSWIPTEQRWLYMIKTPFATWPKFVVGYTDSDNETPEIVLQCGAEWTALKEFDELNLGDHP